MQEILIIIQQSMIYDWRHADQVVIKVEQPKRKLFRRNRLPQVTFTTNYPREKPHMSKENLTDRRPRAIP